MPERLILRRRSTPDQQTYDVVLDAGRAAAGRSLDDDHCAAGASLADLLSSSDRRSRVDSYSY
jgi:hypothetical protein